MWVAEVRYFICADTIVELATRTLELLGLGLFITTEYWMPGRTGYEILKRVKVDPPLTNPAMSSALCSRAALSDARCFQPPKSTLRAPPLSSKHTWPSAAAS
jgi:CheY-like chemotaxis protein